MKALTLTQPWATLVAIGAKTIETRSWSSGHRGPLAIHAAQGLSSVGGMRGLAALIETEPFREALHPHLSGYTPEERAADLPLGGIVAVTTLDYVTPTTGIEKNLQRRGYNVERVLDERERAFGNYDGGRFAWVFGRRCLNLSDPIECKGHLGLWALPEWIRRELCLITDMAMTDEEHARFLAWCNQPQDGEFDRAEAIRQAFEV